MQVILFTDVADTVGYGKYAGTYKIATEIRNNGYSCQVVDLMSFYSTEQLEKIVDKFVTSETVLIGFSCTLSEKRINGQVLNFGRPLKEFENLTSYIKEKNQKTKICVGGARVTLNSYWKNVDYVVINKGDIAIIALLNHLTKGTDLKTVKTNPTNVVDGNDYFYTQDDFAFSRINYVDHDIIANGESLPIEVARGCIFSCAFCHFDLIGKRVGDWQKNKQSLRDELIKNYEQFGTTHYMFTDELINDSLDKMYMMAEIATSLPFKLTYTSYARLDLIWRYPEMRELFVESGAKSLAFGIETMNAVAGKKIGKGLGAEKIKDTLAHCAESWKGKIITSSNFIVGLPGESEQSVRDTVDYLTSDECPLDVFGFLPLYIRTEEDGRGSSKIDQDPEKYGYSFDQGKWVSENMSFETATKLVREIMSDSTVKRKSKLSAATWIGRVLNVGYTIDDIFRILKDPEITREKFHSEIVERSQVRKNDYYNNLIMR